MSRRISRGLRNLNPGNIRRGSFRYRGERAISTDKAFRQFEAIEWGYRAVFVLLHTYARRYGCRTLEAMIGRYAPPSENDTGAYLRRVCAATHLAPDRPLDTLDESVMRPVVAAISEVENGVPAREEDLLHGWRLFYGDFGPESRHG